MAVVGVVVDGRRPGALQVEKDGGVGAVGRQADRCVTKEAAVVAIIIATARRGEGRKEGETSETDGRSAPLYICLAIQHVAFTLQPHAVNITSNGGGDGGGADSIVMNAADVAVTSRATRTPKYSRHAMKPVDKDEGIALLLAYRRRA